MTDRTLPLWLRASLLLTGLMQFGFGLTVLLSPATINTVWPWPLSPLSARLLGASALVSVPLSVVTAILNRRSTAVIPMVMLLAYRVMQVFVGLIHLDRFDFTRPITWNYFGGGALLGLVLVLGLVLGGSTGKPVQGWPALLRGEAALNLGPVARILILLFAAVYAAIGLMLLVLGANGAWLWMESPSVVTSLTLRLFSSPTTGLALGLWLITRARHWRQVAVPAAGLVTIGFTGTLAVLLELGQLAPATPLGYYVAVTPLILLVIGAYLLLPARSRP
jgi:hypothetical protein